MGPPDLRVAASSFLIIAASAALVFTIASAGRVPPPPLLLTYHQGPLLKDPISLRVIFYGSFSSLERDTLTDFLLSLTASHGEANPIALPSTSFSHPRSLLSTPPLVSQWWSLTSLYHNLQGLGVSQLASVDHLASLPTYPLGHSLTSSHISSLVRDHFSSSPLAPSPLYIVFTAHDVLVEGFCMHSCGQHSFLALGGAGGGEGRVPFAWVGNPQSQCLGFCAWPFARPDMGPPSEPLRAPNAAAVDGMIITLAKLLVGACTNPFGDAYYQGGTASEGAGACAGVFGAGAYPGFPGHLLEDPVTNASYNMVGWKSKKFLVPWMWNPRTLACAGQP